ncbi:hypothetical protein GGR58DRAFT_496868 [Xylaria digitata]|nr:hypothetical protein GGR58DRAFT_496868 [Xylaria digitata]
MVVQCAKKQAANADQSAESLRKASNEEIESISLIAAEIGTIQARIIGIINLLGQSDKRSVTQTVTG